MGRGIWIGRKERVKYFRLRFKIIGSLSNVVWLAIISLLGNYKNVYRIWISIYRICINVKDRLENGKEEKRL